STRSPQALLSLPYNSYHPPHPHPVCPTKLHSDKPIFYRYEFILLRIFQTLKRFDCPLLNENGVPFWFPFLKLLLKECISDTFGVCYDADSLRKSLQMWKRFTSQNIDTLEVFRNQMLYRLLDKITLISKGQKDRCLLGNARRTRPKNYIYLYAFCQQKIHIRRVCNDHRRPFQQLAQLFGIQRMKIRYHQGGLLIFSNNMV